MSHPMMMIMRQLIFWRSFSTFIFYVFVKQSQIMDFDDLKFQWFCPLRKLVHGKAVTVDFRPARLVLGTFTKNEQVNGQRA